MIEPAIRGGVISVREERHFIANNRYLSDGVNFAFCVDTYNLYGGVMQME